MRIITGQKIVFALVYVGFAAAVFAVFARPDPDDPNSSGATTERIPASQLPYRMLAKELVAVDAAAGRRNLVEAAALFAALDRLPPVVPPEHDCCKARTWSLQLPDRTQADRHCLRVIGYVTCLPDEPPGMVAAAVGRLEGEFADQLRLHGAIRLTTVSAAAEAQMELARREWSRSRFGAVYNVPPPAAVP